MNIFLRHGEVKNPKDILYYNTPGYELSEKGIKQAEHIAEKLKKDFKIGQYVYVGIYVFLVICLIVLAT